MSHKLYQRTMTIEGIIGSVINNYRLVNLIGSGAYGLVFLAQDMYTDQLVAIKCIGKRQRRDKNVKHSEELIADLKAYFNHVNHHDYSLKPLNLKKLRDADSHSLPCPFLREVSLQLQVQDHPGIIKIHTILDSPVALFVVMDYYSESDLFVNIVDRQVYASSPSLIKSVFTQLVDAVAYCHAHGIAHCDIKPENVLCSDHGSRVALADFGLAVQSHFIQAKTCIGSSYYMPPERLANMNHDLHGTEYPAAKGDIWSLAIILVNLCCTRNPWTKACEQDATYRAYKKNPHVLKEILNISDELYEILHDCLSEEPSERITLFELRERVLKCRSFAKTGALACCDDMEQSHSLLMECALPESNTLSGSSSSTEDHITAFTHDHLQQLQHGYPTKPFNEPSVSMMTNLSFNMNAV